MANELSLKLIGYSDFEAESIASIMFLAQRRLTKSWRIVKNMAADFYLLSETLMPHMHTNERLKNLPPERCIFTVQEHLKNASQLEILVDVHNVPHLQDLVTVFNNLSVADDSQPAKQIFTYNATTALAASHRAESSCSIAIDSSPISQQAAKKPTFTPDYGFLGCLLAYRNQQQLQLTIILKNQSPQEALYIYPEAQVFYSRAGFEQLLPFFSARSDELLVETKVGDQVAIKDLVDAECFRPYSLSSLIWYTAFKSSQGRLLEGVEADAVVKLTHWPDITLPGCRELMKLAAFMHGNAASLQAFADKLDLPIATVIDFYNACELIGIIEHKPQADLHNKQLPTEKSSLLAKIQSRLNKEIAPQPKPEV